VIGDVEITLDFKGLKPFIEQRQAYQMRHVIQEVDYDWMRDAIDWMQAEAPWQDDTNFARATLHIEPEYTKDTATYHFKSDAPYMIYLELNRGGQYAILGDTVNQFGPELLDRLEGLV
jgi:hypothetical protein